MELVFKISLAGVEWVKGDCRQLGGNRHFQANCVNSVAKIQTTLSSFLLFHKCIYLINEVR